MGLQMVSEGVSGFFLSCIGWKYYFFSSLERVLVLVWINQKQWSKGMIHIEIEDGTTVSFSSWKPNFLLSKIGLPTTIPHREIHEKVGEISLKVGKSGRQNPPNV